MANSATRNQERALATAAASEQATAKIGIVATAAEEIAQSIEHIATRVASSATIASQATGEAKAITDAVESLSASVDEIGEVSDLGVFIRALGQGGPPPANDNREPRAS
jgi:methyl-accepting chemotaxis protein